MMEISSVILRVSDMEQSVAFWSEAVGLTVASESPAFVFLDGGPIPLNLSLGDPVKDESLTEVVFESDDVRADHRAMTERGVPFEVDLRTIMPRNGQELIGAHFRDPDGHYGSLTGWVDRN